ncbi:MAG TPA: 5'/3'-nucleotidase SurE [Ardenticatenaceae bacterium]|jgi:5'-nucleotidase
MTDHDTPSRPLILVTNDDGIASPGLHAAVNAVAPLGELLVAAPKTQQTAAGRSLMAIPWKVERYDLTLRDGTPVNAYAVEGTPAQAVRGGLLLLSERRPDLLVSGISYGENVGVGVTISGTVGAAIEGATFGVPGLAVSLETDIKHHLVHSDEVDFSTAAYFTHLFARMMLELSLPAHTDLLKLDIPRAATPETPWRITRVSRQSYWRSLIEEIEGTRQYAGYERSIEPDTLEPDSDIYAIVVDEVISVTPMTIDLTANEDFAALAEEVKQALGRNER